MVAVVSGSNVPECSLLFFQRGSSASRPTSLCSFRTPSWAWGAAPTSWTTCTWASHSHQGERYDHCAQREKTKRIRDEYNTQKVGHSTYSKWATYHAGSEAFITQEVVHSARRKWEIQHTGSVTGMSLCMFLLRCRAPFQPVRLASG